MEESLAEKKDICIRIDFERGSENPQRVFESMSHIITSIEFFHACLLSSVSSETKTKFLLADVKEGSIESWLSPTVTGEKSTETKGKLVDFLNKCTEIVLDFISEKDTIKNIDELDLLERKVSAVAGEMKVEEFPNVFYLDKYRLLKGYSEIGKATKYLNDVDEAYFKTLKSNNKINKGFYLSDEDLQALVIEKVDSSRSKETLIIKKPDLLGRSMWDFIRNKVTIPVKMRDEDWLNKFHQRLEIIAPGDGLHCDLLTLIYYDKKGVIVDMKYEVLKVHNKVDFNFNQLEIDHE